MYRILRVGAGMVSKVDAICKDDLVARQSITLREARTLGLPGEGSLVLVEGSEAGVARAQEILKDAAQILTGAEAEAAYKAFRAQDEEAASGLGLVFGP